MITRTVYAETPPRVEYALSEKGKSIIPLLISIATWGMENLSCYCNKSQSNIIENIKCAESPPSTEQLLSKQKGILKEYIGDTMKKKNERNTKIKILFVDEINDLASQIAEYFLNEIYGDVYEGYSAGPSWDFVDCELISVMYQQGYDIRKVNSKDFTVKQLPGKLDYIAFLEQATYDRIKDIIPWDAPKFLKPFRKVKDFTATDDYELAQCYIEYIEEVKLWVIDTFKDPGNLKTLV